MTSSAPASIALRRRTLAIPAVWAATAAVVAVRLATAPRSLWEHDEGLFALAVQRFDPLAHHPHPPGYPLYVGLGKLLAPLAGDPFLALVALSVLSAAVALPALFAAFRRLAAPFGDAAEGVALAGALLFLLSPALLVQGSLPVSDAPALAFLALALAAAARLDERPTLLAAVALGGSAAAAVGCRPQLVVAVAPFLLFAWSPRLGWRGTLAAIAAFGVVALAWFVPLAVATGGPGGLLDYQLGHAGKIAEHELADWRAQWPAARLVARFLAHPWGRAATSLPMLALAAVGAAALLRRRARSAAPLAALATAQLAFCLAALEPADGVRYALPVALFVAFAAAAGSAALAARLGRPRLAPWPLAALIVAGAAYAWPVLAARAAGPAPPASAAAWIRDQLPASTAVLVAKTLLPHAALLLPDRERVRLEATPEMFAAAADRPVVMLTEGESSWPGARIFAWPPSDAFGKLTRGQYRVVSVSPLPPERRFAALRGVHPYEPNGPDGWWWLADDCELRLYPAGRQSVRLALRLPPVVPFAANRIAFGLDGVPAGELTLARGERREVTLALPAGAASVALGLRAATGIVPAESGVNPRDRRRVAVQLLGLEMLR